MFNIFKKKSKTTAELCFSTDIHCHIVPGVDDGSPDAVTSADLIERMQGWGIKRILASPHVTQDTFENDHSTIDPAMAKLHAELQKRGNDIQVANHAEYRIDELFQHRLEINDIMPLPGNYLLIENPFFQEPWNLDQLVFDLQVKGYSPILAHPERYAYYYTRKDRFKTLHNAGLSLQINLLSLAGYYGKGEQKTAEYLIKEGLVDFIGTDLHKAAHADRIDAYLLTSDARAHMKDLRHLVQNDKAFPAS